MEYKHTKEFIGKPYTINNPSGVGLTHGDRVVVHPTERSQARKPFNATVVFQWIKWTENPCVEVCTNVDGGYIAVMNEYLFNRLELIRKNGIL